MPWGSLLGGLALGAFGYKGAKDQNLASASQAQRQMDFQREMSNTAIQRRMADLRTAGLNPILAGKHEASSPSGAMAPMVNKAAVALQNASSAANIQNIMAQTNYTNAKAALIRPGSAFFDAIGSGVEEGIESAQTLKEKFQRLTGINISEAQFGKWFQADPEAMRDLLSDIQNSTTSAFDSVKKKNKPSVEVYTKNEDGEWKRVVETNYLKKHFKKHFNNYPMFKDIQKRFDATYRSKQ